MEKFTHTLTSYKEVFFLDRVEKMVTEQFEKLRTLTFNQEAELQIYDIGLYCSLFDPVTSQYV